MKVRKKFILLWIFLVFMLIQFMSIQAFASDFNVTIPKTITLDGNKESSYSVKVEGEIAANETISVQPVEQTFLMRDLTEKNPKADVTASIKSTKTEWNSTDVLNSVVSDDNGVSAQGLSAGNWKGTFEFQISINKTLKLETDGDVTIEVGSTLQTNAYLNDEVVNNIVSWVSDNENIVIENGVVSTTENTTSGEEANVTVTYIDTATGKQLQATFKVTVIGSKYGNVVARTGYCGADETYEAVIFTYPSTLENSDGDVRKYKGDTCYTNAKYTYYSDTKTLVISGVGSVKGGRASVYSGTTENASTYRFSLPRTGYGDLYNKVNHVVIEDGITSLGISDFEHFINLKDIKLGNTLEVICDEAFSETESLTELIIPDSIKAMGSSILANSGVKKVTVGKGLESFSQSCFSNMSYCEEIRYNAIDAKMEVYQNGNFYECFYNVGHETKNGTIFYIGEDVESIPDNFLHITQGSSSILSIKYNKAKIKSIIFEGENLKSIGANAFDYCMSIRSIDLPDSIEIIGDAAFSGCEILSAVDLGTNLKQIGSGAFASTAITEIRLPDTLTTIGASAFAGCPLNSLYLPKSVNIINKAPFYGCNFDIIYCGADEKQEGWETDWNLKLNNKGSSSYYKVLYGITRDEFEYHTAKEIRIPNTITTITQQEIQKYPNMETVYIPSSVTSIDNYAFSGCSKLKNVIFEEGSQLETIGNYAFNGCTSLKSIEIPDNVTSMGNYAFNGCSSLQGVVFGEASQLETISDHMFENCTNLIEMKIPDSVTSIGNNAFKGCSNLKMVYIPLSVKTIAASSYTNSPFYNVSKQTLIYCAADKKQSGWGYYWNYYSSDKLTVIFSASKDDYDQFSAKNVVFPNTLTSVTEQEIKKYPAMETIYIPNTVTSIENRAFYGNKGLKAVIFEEGSQLKTIGDYAFDGCSQLTDIELPNSVISIGNYSFNHTDSLTKITISNSIISIGDYAFRYCKNLSEIIFEEGSQLETVGKYAFQDCTNLERIEIPSSTTSICDNAFSGATNLKNVIFGNESQLTTIGNYAFQDCASLESIEIPNNLTSMGTYAFSGCTNLKNVIFGDEGQLKIIAGAAFLNCRSLESIEIPNNITSIYADAFNGCKNLRQITVPVSTAFLSNSFANCTNITTVHLTKGTGIMTTYTRDTYRHTPWYISRNSIEEISIENGVTNIGDYFFYNCSGLMKIIIPDSVISIGNYAFQTCTSLESIEIPNSVISIGNYAFSECKNLANIRFEEGSQLETIGNYAFQICESLESIELPNSVTSIGNCAFWGCINLVDIRFEEGSQLETIGNSAFKTCVSLESIELPNSVTSIGNSAFFGCENLKTIYIPSSVITIAAATSYYNSPFNQCSSTLQIYCGASEKPDGWGTYWNYYASGKTLPTTFDVTREEYENLLISATSLLCEDEMVDNILTKLEDISENTAKAENEENTTDIEITSEELETNESTDEEKLVDIEATPEELETNESTDSVEMLESTENPEDVETLEEMSLQENEDIESNFNNTENNN